MHSAIFFSYSIAGESERRESEGGVKKSRKKRGPEYLLDRKHKTFETLDDSRGLKSNYFTIEAYVRSFGEMKLKYTNIIQEKRTREEETPLLLSRWVVSPFGLNMTGTKSFGSSAGPSRR